MKKLLVIALALFTFNGFAQEETKQNTEGKKITAKKKIATPIDAANEEVDMLTKRLNLTPEQQTKVRELFVKIAEENEVRIAEVKRKKNELRSEQDKGDTAKTKSHKLSQKTELQQKLKEILDEKQYETYMKYFGNRGQRKNRLRSN
ncbi:MAG: hypothetical protein Wins2KO_24020 [Winogradskyella sp.]